MGKNMGGGTPYGGFVLVCAILNQCLFPFLCLCANSKPPPLGSVGATVPGLLYLDPF